MNTILTVTFNPALDKSTTIDELIPEKKLACAAPVFDPGGGGINVARAIKKLGAEAVAVYLSGGDTGSHLTALLREEKVEPVSVPTKGLTRENLVVLETSTGKQFRFGMPGAVVTEDEVKTLLGELEAHEFGYLVVSGSIPQGVPDDIFVTLAAIAKSKSARLIADTSGKPLTRAAQAGVFLLKPNLNELAALAGRDKVSLDEAEGVARELIGRGYCELLVVSMGGSGALLVTADRSLRQRAPILEVKSTVGAGDSMVAGLTLALSQGGSLEEALRFGVACGSAATIRPGTGLCRREDVDRLVAELNEDH